MRRLFLVVGLARAWRFSVKRLRKFREGPGVEFRSPELSAISMFDPTKITDPPVPAFDQVEPANIMPDRLVTGVFEPPNSFLVRAIARHKLVILLTAIALAAAGVAVGRSRNVSYTAAATLQVGQVNPNSPGFYGYVQSSTSLATAFSRSVSSEYVLRSVNHKLKLAPSQALARLSAAPIPQAPAFRVIATGSSAAGAIALANAAAKAVITYESHSNNTNPEARSLLREYREASVGLWHATENIARLVHRSKGSFSKQELARAEANKNAQAARFKAIGSAYNAAILSQAPSSGLVSLLAGATSATNNRMAKTELFGFLGLLAGIVLGCCIAALHERRRSASKTELSGSQPA